MVAFPAACHPCLSFAAQGPAPHAIASRALFWYHSIRDERIMGAPASQPRSATPPAPSATAGTLQPRRAELERLLRRIRDARLQLKTYETFVNDQLRVLLLYGARPKEPNVGLRFLAGRRAVILLLQRWVGTLRRAARAQRWLVLRLEEMAGAEEAGRPRRPLDLARQARLAVEVAYGSQQLRYACALWEDQKASGLEEARAVAAEQQQEADREQGFDCVICMEDDLERWQWLPCLHVLCEACTAAILASTGMCPQCRRGFKVLGPGDGGGGGCHARRIGWGAHRALCEMQPFWDPFAAECQGGPVTTVFPSAGLLRLFKNLDHE